jgi:hypothetical protein
LVWEYFDECCANIKNIKYFIIRTMSNIRITSVNGQLNGTSSTFGTTIQDGNNTILQTTYLPKTSDNLQVYRYVCSATSTVQVLTGNTVSISLPSAGVGLGSGRFGQLTIRLTVLMIDGSGGVTLSPRIMDQYLLSTGIDGTGNIVQPPHFTQLLSSSMGLYIPTAYSVTTVDPDISPGFSLIDTTGIFTLTVASSTTTAPGSTFDVIADFDIISGSV